MAGTRAGAAKRKAAQMQGQRPKQVIVDEFNGEAPWVGEQPDKITPKPVKGCHPQAPQYVVGPKRALMHEGKRLEAGEPVPGAHLWPRLESWLNTGRIVKV